MLVIWVLYGSKFEQSIPNRRITPRILPPSLLVIFASWWIFVVIFNVVYKSKLTSLMVMKPSQKPTMQNLVDDGYTIVLDGTATYIEMFLENEEELIKQSTTRRFGNKCDILKLLKKHKVFMPAELTLNFVHYKIICGIQNFDDYFFEEISVTPHAWLFKPGTSFIKKFNQQIMKVMKGGLLEKWENDVLINNQIYDFSKKIDYSKSNNVINFDLFFLHFLIYLVLVVISIFCFLGEILYSRWFNKLKIFF